MIRIICCYNRENQYKDMVSSIKLSKTDYSLIPVNNADNCCFTSAAQALNYGATQADEDDILVFTHQDVLFSEGSIEKLIEQLEDNVIAGPYGAARERRLYKGGPAYEAETLDECCVAMNYKTWERYRFNEEVCDSWHMYVVELCLRMRLAGGRILWVPDTGIEHPSYGNVDMSYMRTYKKIIKEFLHSKDIKWIETTCRSYPTNWIGFYRLFIPRYIKRRLKERVRGKYV